MKALRGCVICMYACLWSAAAPCQETRKPSTVQSQMKALAEFATKRGQKIEFDEQLKAAVGPSITAVTGLNFYSVHYDIPMITEEIRIAADGVQNPDLKRLLTKLADSKNVDKKIEFVSTSGPFDLTFLDGAEVQGDDCQDECEDICYLACPCIARGNQADQACHRECKRVCHRVCR